MRLRCEVFEEIYHMEAKNMKTHLLTSYLVIMSCMVIIMGCNEPDNNASYSHVTKIENQTISQKTQKIVGGNPSSNRPWMVALIDASKTEIDPFCGGSLLGPKWILTAAHCVENETTETVVVWHGSNSLLETGTRYTVKQIIVHPDYDKRTNDSDMALLEMATALPVDRFLTIIPDDSTIYTGESIVMGWGQTEEFSSTPTTQLMETTIPIVSNADCKGVYSNDEITQNMICAGDILGEKDACYGDSGGPLIVYHGGRLVQVGIVSWGEGCARSGYYGVYTRVSKFYDFIIQYITSDHWETSIQAIPQGDIQNFQRQITIGGGASTNQIESPPNSPQYACDLYIIQGQTEHYSQDIQNALHVPMLSWIIAVNPSGNMGGDTIQTTRLTWNPNSFSKNGIYFLQQGYDNKGKIIIPNMRETHYLDVTGMNELFYYTLYWVQDHQSTLNLSKGWNLISLPRIPIDPTASTLFPNINAIYEFKYHTYIEPQTLSPGIGYWVLSEEDQAITIIGKPYTIGYHTLSPGWHLLGATDHLCQVQSDLDISQSVIYGWDTFNNRYESTNQLQSTQGYWIKVDQACEITMTRVDIHNDIY